jgi:hypothetical protein
MSQNSIAPFVNANVGDLLETIGVTQFLGEYNWFQVLGGLILQGGLRDGVASGGLITLNTGFPKQVLGVFITPKFPADVKFSAGDITTQSFKIFHDETDPVDFYWFAIGV